MKVKRKTNEHLPKRSNAGKKGDEAKPAKLTTFKQLINMITVTVQTKEEEKI